MRSRPTGNPAGNPRGRDVLLIEDDVLQAHEIETHLASKGFTVSKRAGGSDSLHNLSRLDPKVVIVDYHLPDIDGMTVASRILRLAPQAAVILISGRIDFPPATTLDRLGVAGFFRKPLDMRALRGLVSKLVRNAALSRT